MDLFNLLIILFLITSHLIQTKKHLKIKGVGGRTVKKDTETNVAHQGYSRKQDILDLLT